MSERLSTLHGIERSIAQVIETGYAFDEETGEVLFDSSALEGLEMARQDKIVACGAYIKSRRAFVSAMREEERAMRRRRETAERALERLETYVLSHMDDGERVEGVEAEVGTRRSTRVVVDDPDAVPGEYERTTVTTAPDKKAIAAVLRAGGDVPGCHLETVRNLSVR